MSIDEVKLTLVHEAQLLQSMIDNVEASRGEGFTKQAQFIKNSWGRFLRDRQKTNLALCTATADELRTDLKNELAQVEKYLEHTVEKPDYTETWIVFLECERDILKHLIEMC